MRPLALILSAALAGGMVPMLWVVGENPWLYLFGLALGASSIAVLIREMMH